MLNKSPESGAKFTFQSFDEPKDPPRIQQFLKLAIQWLNGLIAEIKHIIRQFKADIEKAPTPNIHEDSLSPGYEYDDTITPPKLVKRCLSTEQIAAALGSDKAGFSSFPKLSDEETKTHNSRAPEDVSKESGTPYELCQTIGLFCFKALSVGTLSGHNNFNPQSFIHFPRY